MAFFGAAAAGAGRAAASAASRTASNALTQMVKNEQAQRALNATMRQGELSMVSLAQRGITTLTNSLTNTTGAVANLAQAFTLGLVPIGQFHELLGSIGPLVAAANPGAMFVLTNAMNNLAATAGEILTPVVTGLTYMFQGMGDTLAKMAPVVQPLFDEIGKFFAGQVQQFAQLYEAAAPFVQLFFDTFTKVLNQAAKGLAFFRGMLTALLEALARMFGVTSRFDKNAHARAAVSNIGFSSVDEMAKKNFELAAQAAIGGDVKTDSEYLAEIAEWAQKGKEVMEKLTAAIEALVAWLKNREQEGSGIQRGAEGGLSGRSAEDTRTAYELRRQNLLDS